MSATARFYVGFFLAIAIVVAASYYAGLRAGIASVSHEVRAHRAAP